MTTKEHLRPCHLLERVSLGWRFALLTTVTVSGIVGVASVQRLSRDIEHDRQDRIRLVDDLLGSLVTEVETSPDLATAQARIDRSARQIATPGRSSFRLDLVDDRGTILASSDPKVLLRFDASEPEGSPYVHLPVFSSFLGSRGGSLAVWIDAPSFAVEARSRWRSWFTELMLLVVSILATLVVTNHFLVTRPLHRLREGVRRMGRGYLGVLEDVREAPEFRDLAHSIWRLGNDLELTVRRLVEAQRRAMNVPPPQGLACTLPSAQERPGCSPPQAAEVPADVKPPATLPAPTDADLARSYLLSELRLLETQDPRDPEVIEHARFAWDRDVAIAERLGDMTLRSRLDNAALRVLDPQAWERLNRYLGGLTDSPPEWLGRRQDEIRAALDQAHVPLADLACRAKHVAGIWRKMQALDIDVDQVQDLFGFRLLVPSTGDCYRALDALHRRFEPQLLSFKDYIAHPKENGYRSLHTHLRAADGPVFEVQIRTPEMHMQADGPDGDAAHWRYKVRGRGGAWRIASVGRSLLGRLASRLSSPPAP